MREIKFRGKTGRNEWIYGNFIDWGNHEQTYIFPLLNNATSLNLGESIMATAKWVDINTVGQFTGLYDKNGKEIYEGDIVSLNKDLLGSYVVKYDIKNARFSMYRDNYEQAGFNLETMKNYEVISNIYDNPELIKE